MKKTVLLIALVTLFISVHAQENPTNTNSEEQVTVPQSVQDAFLTKFPNALKVNWGIEKAGEYEVEFSQNKSEMSALFDEKGTLLELETEIGESELPTVIKSVLSKDYADFKIDEVEKIEANGITTFEMKAKKDQTILELVFDTTGKLLQKEEKAGAKSMD